MGWFTCQVLTWHLSNTLGAPLYVEALNEAIHRFGAPGIMNTDQDSRLTSFAWTDHQGAGIRLSMSKGRCAENVLFKRLRRSRKYEGVYLHLRHGIAG